MREIEVTELKPHEIVTAIRERVTPTALAWLNGASQETLDELIAFADRHGVNSAVDEIESLAKSPRD